MKMPQDALVLRIYIGESDRQKVSVLHYRGAVPETP